MKEIGRRGQQCGHNSSFKEFILWSWRLECETVGKEI